VRSLSLTALILSIGLLGLSVGMAVNDHGQRRTELERGLTNEAASHASALESAFERSRTITLIMAHTDALREFYEQPGGRRQKLARGQELLAEADDALGYVGTLFPSTIRELSFVDRGGAVNASMLDGVSVPRTGLSRDVRTLPFFRPTFALDPGHVLQSRPYRSPGSGDWVIANATPVPVGTDVSPAIVHYDLTVESFRQLVEPSDGEYDVRIVDARTGQVIADGARPLTDGARLGAPDRALAALARRRAPSGTLAVEGHLAAYDHVRTLDANQNRWIVVASSSAAAASLLGDLRAAPIALALVALVLVAFALVSLRASRRELQDAATTDVLTGLANRRMLMADLERRVAVAQGEPLVLLLFDLNGFKKYNDTFGHPAGDALLARLGHALVPAVAPHNAYRLGGDEFCVLATAAARDEVELAAMSALHERGEGFSISASYGTVTLPEEAQNPLGALRIADQRMYAQKAAGRSTAGRESCDVLLQALTERHPDLSGHLTVVAELTEAVARRVGLEGVQLDEALRAAELHDIGKVAIPDAILTKPGPLDEEEWAFIRRHTLIGERIVSAAPALACVGRLIRATHERWDGGGYPDRLAGSDIPLSARIVAVCDAFDAMVSDRSYRPARPVDEALAELRRCAGTQFDPAIVDAFSATLAARNSQDTNAFASRSTPQEQMSREDQS
jgi:diguanylate cyclase (GGDEF)-like protein